MLRAYAEASVVGVEAQFERATRKNVGTTDEEVLDWLRRHEFTKKEGEAIMRTAKAEEGGARTVWELVNGGTAVARAIPHNEDRVLLEKIFIFDQLTPSFALGSFIVKTNHSFSEGASKLVMDGLISPPAQRSKFRESTERRETVRR